MDSMLSHGVARVKAVTARLSGLVGVFQTLASQHAEVKVLLERAKTNDERFADLWPTIRRELISHEEAERREVYPVMRSHVELAELADHHDAEAAQLDMMIASLDSMVPATAERRAAFERLIDTVTEHAQEEEKSIFPKAQEVLGKSMAMRLDASFQSAKRKIAQIH
jgi:hemerythrin superfamily protein